MSRIKGKNTKPELLVRKFLFDKRFRYRLNKKDLQGKPDLVLPKYNTVIFINGCFWHGHQGCRYFVIPQTRTDWWLEKINGTRLRDQDNIVQLKASGWNVITIWECQLNKQIKQNTLNQLKTEIIQNMNLTI
jgi:DNA mismatch endonuclease (patch repair protein)